MDSITIGKLGKARIICRLITIVASTGFIPLAIFAPWSSERIIEDYGFYGAIYTVYHYNIYLALAYILPVIGLLVVNGSVKRYFKRLKDETVSPVRVSPTETVFVARNSSRKQQIQQIGVIKLHYCIICGQPNDFDSKFCKYCGDQF